MKRYHGIRTENGPSIVVEEEQEQCHGLDPRHDLRTHSVAGFDWACSESGSAQLALALAADVLADDKRALKVYQRLNARLIQRLPEEEWMLTESEIRQHIAALEPERPRSL